MEKPLIGKWIAMLNRATHMHVNSHLGKEGIGAGQYPFLLFIGRCSGCSQDEIARSLCFDKGTTARALKKLEEAGFITRTVSSKDQRRHEVNLTEKGSQMRAKVRKLLEDWHKKHLEQLPKETRAFIEESLEKMAMNAIASVKQHYPPHQTQRSDP